jgi:hypothetical protein
MRVFRNLMTVAMTGALAWACVPLPANAQGSCIEDAREVKLSEDSSERLKSYLCKTEPNGAPKLRVDFHRLGYSAPGLLIAKQSSPLLEKAIGKPRLVENEVLKTYAEILKRFSEPGTYERVNVAAVTTSSPGLGSGPSEALPQLQFRTLENDGGFFFPAPREIASLHQKIIPDKVSFFHSLKCLKWDEKYTTCQEWDRSKPSSTVYWRSLESNDLKNYEGNLVTYNRLMKLTGDKVVKKSPFTTRKMQFLDYLAGDSGLPEGFSIIQFSYSEGDCGVDQPKPGIHNWYSSVSVPDLSLDAVVITNVSTERVHIAALLGARAADSKLRRLEGPSSGPSGKIDGTELALSPGESALVPTRTAVLVSSNHRAQFKNEAEAADLHRRVAMTGYKGNTTDHRAPPLVDYAFGPELAVTGFEAGGARVELADRAPNFVNLTVASLEGSCPYLLSRRGSSSAWVNHGKVLDKAPRKALAYTEARTFKGFRSQFRLEEREPEIALINAARLNVTLKGGGRLVVLPDNAGLARGSGKPVRLLYGEAVDITFHLPRGISRAKVASSRLEVTGYYRRYTSLVRRPGRDAGPPMSLMQAIGVKRAALQLSPLPVAKIQSACALRQSASQ